TGKGDATVYRATPPEDLYAGNDMSSQGAASQLWVLIHHEGPLTVEQMLDQGNLDEPTLRSALAQLLAEKQVVAEGERPARYRADECIIPLGAREGWEVALLDQFQALVRSMCIKLANGQTRALPDDEVGGS